MTSISYFVILNLENLCGGTDMDQNRIICVYCKKNAELIKSNNRTAIICTHCGIAVEAETYKELFDTRIYNSEKKDDLD